MAATTSDAEEAADGGGSLTGFAALSTAPLAVRCVRVCVCGCEGEEACSGVSLCVFAARAGV